MKISKKMFRMEAVLMMSLVLVLLLLLTGCQTVVAANDKNNECDHPEKPKKPYTDKRAALYIVAQGEVISKCRALLGKETPAF